MLLGYLVSPGESWFAWKKKAEEIIQWAMVVFIAVSVVTFFIPNTWQKSSIDSVITFHNQMQNYIWIAQMEIHLRFTFWKTSPPQIEKLGK